VQQRRTGIPRVQVGILRTNCVDSLDRTNASQFCVGKIVLGHQLYALGVVDDPKLVDFGTDVVDVVIDMYEGMGNQIALQYAGSELVNTIRTYNAGGWATHSRDLFTTVKRYYSNSFTDAEKQDSINLFLGVFIPHRDVKSNGEHLWDIESDLLFHQRTDRIEHVPLYKEPWWQKSLVSFATSLKLGPMIQPRIGSSRGDDGSGAGSRVDPAKSHDETSRSALGHVRRKRYAAALWQRRLYFDAIHHPEKFTSFDLMFGVPFAQPFESPSQALLAQLPSEPPSLEASANADGPDFGEIRRWALTGLHGDTPDDVRLDKEQDEALERELGSRSYRLRRGILEEYVNGGFEAPQDEHDEAQIRQYTDALFVSAGWMSALPGSPMERQQTMARMLEYSACTNPLQVLDQEIPHSDVALYEETCGSPEHFSGVPRETTKLYLKYTRLPSKLTWWS
jgi:hypothetical protein